MKILLQCLLLLSCNALALSSEILAWKTPISTIAPEGLEVSGVKRLDKPPEASPFFGPKDELWDIMALAVKPDKERTDSPEWVVWNGTSGRIVAKGSWVALMELRPHISCEQTPIQGRIKIDLYQVATDESPPDANKKPDASISFLTRSGQVSNISQADQNASIQFDSIAYFSEENSLISLQLNGSVSLTKNSVLHVDSNMTLYDQLPIWFARDFDGEAGIDIMVSFTIELIDGTPYNELVLRQQDNLAVPYQPLVERGNASRISLEDKEVLIWAGIGSGELLSLYGVTETEESEDPFENRKTHAFDLIQLKEVKVPEKLTPYFFGTVYDVSDAIKNNGIAILEGDFVGYDFERKRIFMSSSNMLKIDMFDQLFMKCDGGNTSLNIAINLHSHGNSRLLSRSGTKSGLQSAFEESNFSRNFEIEPTLGASNEIIDLRFNIDEKIGEKSINSLDSSVTLENGKLIKVLEKGQADGTKTSIELKAERLELK